jgi:excisionase family DNA binding protein
VTAPDHARHQLLRRREVARVLAVSVRSVDRLVQKGVLPVVELDRRPRFLDSDVEELIKSRRTCG